MPKLYRFYFRVTDNQFWEKGPDNCIHKGEIIRSYYSYEPRHDKTNKVTVRPAKTQISLGFLPV